VDLDRIAAVIAPFGPDIVALQEVDAGRPRSGGVDQAHELASRLGMSAPFTACIEQDCERYGLPPLTPPPVLAARPPPAPHRASGERRAPRIPAAPCAGDTAALAGARSQPRPDEHASLDRRR